MTATLTQALIIDDEPDIRELLDITLSRMDINCTTAANVTEALALLKTQQFDFCLSDMRLPDGDGLQIVEFIQTNCPQLPVAVITAHGNMELAIECLKAGAFDFVNKPVELTKLRQMIEKALAIAASPVPQDLQSDTTALIGNAASIEAVRKKIIKLGRSQAPVFISGESGSGKELVARLIHQNSPRKDQPFIPVNCGAIPSELMESEFFGHKKGSFTGANADKHGLFEAARGGTLFLDEVADLPLAMQVKLLRVIQEKAVRAIGDHDEIPTDVRILSATHKNLQHEVEDGRFRSDLFYRINVIELAVPPLRDRADDISLLIERTLHNIATETGLASATLAPEAMQALLNYPFPGNVRELENILERAYTLCDDDVIHLQDLQLQATNTNDRATNNPLYPSAIKAEEAFSGLDEFLENIEKDILLNALEQCKWNKTAAAELLGISFRAMRYKLKKYALDS